MTISHLRESNIAATEVTMLLVEDNPVFMEQLIFAVERLPFKSKGIACDCGEQALELTVTT